MLIADLDESTRLVLIYAKHCGVRVEMEAEPAKNGSESENAEIPGWSRDGLVFAPLTDDYLGEEVWESLLHEIGHARMGTRGRVGDEGSALGWEFASAVALWGAGSEQAACVARVLRESDSAGAEEIIAYGTIDRRAVDRALAEFNSLVESGA